MPAADRGRGSRFQLGVGRDLGKQLGKQAEASGLQTQRRHRIDRPPPVLRSADAAVAIGSALDQPGVSHLLEMQPHGVRVEVQPRGNVRRRKRLGRAGELLIDGVARAVRQEFEQGQPVHPG